MNSTFSDHFWPQGGIDHIVKSVIKNSVTTDLPEWSERSSSARSNNRQEDWNEDTGKKAAHHEGGNMVVLV